jgi:hypothetical protein
MVAPDLRFIILGEDHGHVNFVRRWLLSEGIGARQIIQRNVAADASDPGGRTSVSHCWCHAATSRPG